MNMEKNEQVLELNLRKFVGLYIEKNLWTEFKKLCENKDIRISRRIERLIKQEIENNKKA